MAKGKEVSDEMYEYFKELMSARCIMWVHDNYPEKYNEFLEQSRKRMNDVDAKINQFIKRLIQ